jgi:flagellar hook-associated protein 1 FlgK
VAVNPKLPGGGAVSAVYDPANTGKLQASDYRLDYDNISSSYALTRLSDNQLIPLSGFPGTPANIEGMTLSLTMPPTGASSFLIRPTFSAAKTIRANISDPKEIAAAATAATLPGDNTNALKLAKLETDSILLGGKATYSDVYGQLVSQAGTLTHAAKVSSSAQQVVLNQATQARENLAGVNLDEEAANLIKFQNSYQAAAQAIAVANSLFDTLIGVVR